MTFEPQKTQPILADGEPVTQRQFYALVMRVSELSIRLDAVERTSENIEATRTSVEKQVTTVDRSLDGCRADMTDLYAKLDRYVFVMLILLGFIAWLG